MVLNVKSWRDERCDGELVEEVIFVFLAAHAQQEPDLVDEKLKLAAKVGNCLALLDAHSCISLHAKLFIFFEDFLLLRDCHAWALIELELDLEPELR